MGVFDDKKFEQLDWMSQLTETIESEINGLLARLPDRLEMNYETIISFMDSSYDLRLSTDSVVRKLIKKSGLKVDYNQERTITDCFQFQIEGDLKLDLENHVMEGKVTLVKIKATLDDQELQKNMGQEGIQHLGRIGWHHEGAFARANEVMELLGELDEHLKHRSSRKKYEAMRGRLEKIFRDNEWRIRDTELANKIGLWIRQYIDNGNLAAFSNFCKVKVMTHQGGPIYSIEEQQ